MRGVIGAKNICAALATLLVFVWLNFLINIFVGYNGIAEGFALRRNIVTMKVLLDQLSTEQKYLENKISRLRSAEIDVDFLEEQARFILGFSEKNEAAILVEAVTK